ncbi:MFS transporter [Roseomonas gilardii]|uniref:MFS transporter n=1 Tax=Roseomonas gilardii TaxID=257708 RepID=UPI000686579D|nr:MFS transporter [Roseomonas gilardii]
MACALLVVGQLYIAIPLTPDIAARFGVDPAQASLTGTAFGLAYAAGFLLLGSLSDRLGRRRILAAGLVTLGAATALVGLAPGFGALLAARAIQGLAAASFPPAALSLVAEALPPRHRPLGVSLMSLAFLAAAPLAPMLAAGSGLHLSALMLWLAPLMPLGALAVLALAPRAVAAVPDEETAAPAPWRDPVLRAAFLAAATVLFGFVAFQVGAQALGEDAQALRLIGLPSLLLCLAAAPLMRRLGGPGTARAGLLLTALALGLAATGAALPAASVLLSAGVAVAVPGLIATVAGRAAPARRGLALALYSVALFLGASVAPPLAQGLAGFGPTVLWLPPAGLLAFAALGLGRAASRHPR